MISTLTIKTPLPLQNIASEMFGRFETDVVSIRPMSDEARKVFPCETDKPAFAFATDGRILALQPVDWEGDLPLEGIAIARKDWATLVQPKSRGGVNRPCQWIFTMGIGGAPSFFDNPETHTRILAHAPGADGNKEALPDATLPKLLGEAGATAEEIHLGTPIVQLATLQKAAGNAVAAGFLMQITRVG